MAKIGVVTTTKYAYNETVSMGLKCTWERASKSVANNKSKIDWTLASDGASGYEFYAGNISLVIDGKTVYSQPDKFLMAGGGAWSVSGSLEVEHDSDGTKDLVISITAGIYAWQSSNCTGSGTFVLDPISRGLARIGNGSAHGKYRACIGNGASYDKYAPYIGNGKTWDVYS